jgi:hypothetical protein
VGSSATAPPSRRQRAPRASPSGTRRGSASSSGSRDWVQEF